jgi:hypothetical protein
MYDETGETEIRAKEEYEGRGRSRTCKRARMRAYISISRLYSPPTSPKTPYGGFLPRGEELATESPPLSQILASLAPRRWNVKSDSTTVDVTNDRSHGGESVPLSCRLQPSLAERYGTLSIAGCEGAPRSEIWIVSDAASALRALRVWTLHL